MKNWHYLSIEETKAQTGISLITEKERKIKQEQFGKNKLEAADSVPEWKKFLAYFHDALMYVLIGASFLKFVTGSFVEGIIVLLVVVLNAAIGYYQERKADESLSGISKLLSASATIETEQGRKTIDTEELVVGDRVYLKPGDVVPADLRLITVNQLKIDEAILTGEVEPVEKQTDSLAEETVLADRINMAYSGTKVQLGTGQGIVVAIGSETEVGKINHSLKTIEEKETPLLTKVNEMNHSIFKGIGFFILLLGLISYFVYGMSLTYILSAIIALIVSSIPEGLPSILTIILSSGVHNMSKQKAIVKALPTVETLGSMTVICSDKTGTLTKNDMTLTSLFVNQNTVFLTDKERQNSYGKSVLSEIMQNCQETQNFYDTKCPITGNATELALLKWTNEQQVLRRECIDVLPFDSAYKYMATIHIIDGKKRIFVKGAPDILFTKATSQLVNDQVQAFDHEAWEEANSTFASKGQRVLAFGYKDVSLNEAVTHDTINGLMMAGLAGIIDPPKESAIKAVKECKQAGVRVVMITGDHPTTAKAIAQQLGLKNAYQAITGEELNQLTPEEWEAVVQNTDVFARTTPDHKLSIVSYLQKQGEIVGMTGDGVNDAPALKKADVGIAMGIKGSDVSKQAADMILVDDNFVTIAKAVKEGRRIFDNLKKTILFYLPTCLAQGLLLIFSILGNLPLPLTTVQILWLNLVASITLSYALGFEPAHKDIMRRKPRLMTEKIISRYTLFRIIYVGFLITLFGFITMSLFSGENLRQTILINAIVFGQALYMINCREMTDSAFSNPLSKNRALIWSLTAMLALQLAMVYLPTLQLVIQTTPLSIGQFMMSIVPSAILFLLVELEKRITRTFDSNTLSVE
ncbi:HAD-IC family P-type ATPase [Enterococcus faecium]|uniref:HAD-IC family P-type ATPase n=1 Tax=Enterococcus faecium TaxID=1352 RepID=UPI000F50E7E5|nr:HAD-IC family P-type ATPase [Enterococcus faecium]EGP4932902.1 HAD-IC family P-type ATPase [Enterococcus faecium]EGP5067941.1 HAD-IC family P-type ATPase [Enterococcus faecium]EME3496894.1 HAD-IC family P-type ATPase [Enterococcus faecium]EME7102032.1 HAD-IC family P-type ATPase [Enterococcus faecium]ROX94247.1 HAD family hydrolase [Enterococcus faecium]